MGRSVVRTVIHRDEWRPGAQVGSNRYECEIWDIIDWYIYLRTGGYHG